MTGTRTTTMWFAVVLTGCTGGAAARQPQHLARAPGGVDFRVSCSRPAQIEFNESLALLHHMTYPQAREGFRRVAALDSTCAMAQWGLAMTYIQPLWPTRPGLRERELAWSAAQAAAALHPPTLRERLFVAQVQALFLDPSSPDYWLRIRRWAEASAVTYDSLPTDDEAAAFYALSLLATSPSDTMSRAHADRAAGILLAIHERNPAHPGAMHYLVHANDVPGRERQSLDVTHGYEAIAPDNPHALHMPTHIYTRLGDWNGVVRGNLRAATAALRYPAGDSGQYVTDEFPHAIEYLVYAYLQMGADSDARAQVARLRSTEHLEPTFKTAFHLVSTQARVALELRDWRAATMIVPREPPALDWDRFAWAEAIAQFARGLGAAHLGNADVAAASEARLGALEGTMVTAGEDLFARNIRLLSLELQSWRAHAAGRTDSSIALMQAAVDLELTTPKNPVTPAPTLPAQELMGDLLMEEHRPGAALASYEAGVAHYPRRLNGLLGAARAARALDDSARARGYYREMLGVASASSHRPELTEARRYAAGAP